MCDLKLFGVPSHSERDMLKLPREFVTILAAINDQITVVSILPNHCVVCQRFWLLLEMVRQSEL